MAVATVRGGDGTAIEGMAEASSAGCASDRASRRFKLVRERAAALRTAAEACGSGGPGASMSIADGASAIARSIRGTGRAAPVSLVSPGLPGSPGSIDALRVRRAGP
ncbi:MAG TPA: hypothetical protein VLM79_18120 [Kofleriaceae bacterium]|nr:hypothetical protein [Kofleriaceae bacterium]